MIKKLRIKIIVLAMLALSGLMLAMSIGMNSLSYRSMCAEADELLALLSVNEGAFPDFDHGGNPPPKRFSRETPYETRYFWVIVDRNGKAVRSDTSRIASVNNTAAAELGEEVMTRRAGKGFVDDFRYLRCPDAIGTRIIFLDCSKVIGELTRFFRISLIISFCAFLAAFFVILYFSGRMVEPVAESYEKQKRFITDAGHEIKTPLAIISANAELLESDMGDRECVADIKQQTKKLAALTNDLVYLAKMEESGGRENHIDFSLSETVSEAADSFKGPAQAKNCRYETDVQPELVMRGDKKAILQLITILLDNAMKYSDENGTIRVELKKQSRNLVFSVYNTTAGTIRNEDLTHVFDRFYRADSSRSSINGGYGIGLSIASAVVTAHRGKIAAKTETGNDFLITVLFPQ